MVPRLASRLVEGLVIASAFGWSIVRYGWADSVFRHAFDLSCFLFRVLFLVFSIPGGPDREDRGLDGAQTPRRKEFLVA